MNATRAATIRLRSSFDGAVSLGRVQTPTLAIVARREEEIRAFKPEPYWLVDATFEADGARVYEGRFHAGRPAAHRDGRGGRGDRRRRARPGAATITKLDKTKRTEKAPLLYDLTSLQREANTRYGFSARRTLAAAQRLYEEHKALTYPRTSSRYLHERHDPGDQADRRARRPQPRVRAPAPRTCTGLDLLPLGARRQRRQGRRPPRDHPDPRASTTLDKMSDDDRRVYDLVARRFLAVFHPEAVFENTRVETTVAEHVFRTRGKVLLVPGWRGVYGELADAERSSGDDDEGREQQLPQARAGRGRSTTREVASPRRRPSRRGATPTRRCSARWRPRASSSTTTSCARR